MEWMWIVARLAVLMALAVLTTWGGTAPVRGLLDRIHRKPGGEGNENGLLKVQIGLPGGYWIGLLERLGVFLSIAAGHPTGIALVLAVKGLGRYPELRTGDDRRGELFIIGTLASILWAAIWGVLARWVVLSWS